MTPPLFESWDDAFLKVVQQQAVAGPLKSASLAEDLKTWTTCLTGAVVEACVQIGWQAAAKGYPFDRFPKPGKEYLNIDVMAFPGDWPNEIWCFPIAAFELENSRSDDRVGYSLWKLLCLRARLRVVCAFRRDWNETRSLISQLNSDVLGAMSLAERNVL